MGAPENYFNAKDEYFLKKGNTYYNLSASQGSILKLLKDKKSELQQYIKSNKIRFRDNPEDALARIAAQYDHLTN